MCYKTKCFTKQYHIHLLSCQQFDHITAHITFRAQKKTSRSVFILQKSFIASLSECVSEREVEQGGWEVQAGLCYLHDGGSSRHSDSLALGRDACTGARSRQNGGTHTDTRQRESERESDTERAKAKEYQTQQEREKSAISKWSVCQRAHTPERSEYVNQISISKAQRTLMTNSTPYLHRTTARRNMTKP